MFSYWLHCYRLKRTIQNAQKGDIIHYPSVFAYSECHKDEMAVKYLASLILAGKLDSLYFYDKKLYASFADLPHGADIGETQAIFVKK